MSTNFPTAIDSAASNPSAPRPMEAAVLAIQTKLGVTTVISGDGTITVTGGVGGDYILTKGSAAAITLPAPASAGQRIRITSYSDFAHVITGTGLIHDGTTGAHNTITFAAFKGASVELIGYDGKWLTQGTVGCTIA